MKQTEQIGKIKQYFQKNKNYYLIGAGLILAFALGMGINCGIAKKVAMVDVQKVVGSDQIWNPNTMFGDMSYFLDFAPEAAKKIAYSSSFSCDKIPKKYQQELNQKQQAVQQAYAQELQKIDTLISEDITKIANEKGYDLVIVKGMVISGADDITEYVIEGVR